jgi:hypothetical protein
MCPGDDQNARTVAEVMVSEARRVGPAGLEWDEENVPD